MQLPTDPIIEISKAREKFFGCAGRMLLPSRETLEALLSAVPAGQLATSEQLRDGLAERFQVEAVCPVTTRKSLQVIASDPASSAPFWRLVKNSGELMALRPGGAAGQAARLEAEGHVVEQDRRVPRVQAYRGSLVNPKEVWKG